MLPYLTIFGAVDYEGRVAGFFERRGGAMINGEGGSFAAEPVADVVGVTIVCFRKGLG